MTVVLKTQSLTKHFGSLAAVDDLSLEIEQGEVFGLLGPNGAGKTTSINLMVGLLKPDSGQVFIHGQKINGGERRLRARIGVCPQSVILWVKLTCLEQLKFMGQLYGMTGREARRRGERLLEELDLSEKRDSLAHTLSGGMQRRLNLALALVHDPDIVVLDEPEAGLDPQSRVRVREYIQSLARRKTVILSTHNMDEADRMADRIAILDHGRLLVLDTPEALKQRVGQGDVVEIGLKNPEKEAALQSCQSALVGISSDVTLDLPSRVLRVRALHAIGQLPAILSALSAAGLQPDEINMRANTLEDVFIQLTGRRLRE